MRVVKLNPGWRWHVKEFQGKKPELKDWRNNIQETKIHQEFAKDIKIAWKYQIVGLVQFWSLKENLS